MQRDMKSYLNSEVEYRESGKLPHLTDGLKDQTVTILGMGNIGKRVRDLALAFEMNVIEHTRESDLSESVKDADIIVDCLGANDSTKGLLGEDFFNSINNGAKLISVSRQEITDQDEMFKALDDGRLGMLATDAGGILVGDTKDVYYQKLLNHPKVVCTPHIAYSSHMSSKMGNDVMIDNVEAYINGNPQNLLN